MTSPDDPPTYVGCSYDYVGKPYVFSEDSNFRLMLLDMLQYIRGELRSKKMKSMVVSSPTIYYKMTHDEIPVDEKLKSCSPNKLNILITLSLTYLGGEWTTKHKKRNATIKKETMENNVIKIFGKRVPWKPLKE